MASIKKYKKTLARIFDGDPSTEFWHNIIDKIILGLIVISTLEVFLSTFTGIAERYGTILHFVDIFTTIVFTIEVSIRIWVADVIDPRYKGFWGRVKYCFSFYGLIDFLSTYPFYLSFLVPIPTSLLKILRTVRIFRVFRYMKSFEILGAAIESKKRELGISMAFLTILTVILSFFLFFAEHAAQPERFENGWGTLVWSFAKYLGDPGKVADFELATGWGHVIAAIVGILGIAIFAVPAGLVGSGFTEVLEKREKKEKTENNIERLRHAFRLIQCRYTKLLHVPAFVSLDDIKSKYRMSEEDILDAVDASNEFRLRNLATTQPIEDRPIDRLVVETFPLNRPYGCCINRDSKITIVSTSSVSEAAIGHFSYYLAKIGGFNYVSKEIEIDPEKPISYYNIPSKDACPNLPLFLNDIDEFARKKDSWVIFILSASGAQEPSYPTQFHHIIGGSKGDESYSDPNITIHDTARYDAMYKDLAQQLKRQYGLDSDIQKYHAGSSSKNIARHINCDNSCNRFTIRIAWSVTCWDFRSLQISKTMSDVFNKDLIDVPERKASTELTKRTPDKDFGFSFYTE